MRLQILLLLLLLFTSCASAYETLSCTQILLVVTAALVIPSLPSLISFDKQYHSFEVVVPYQEPQKNTIMNVPIKLPVCTFADLPHNILPVFSYADLPNCTHAASAYANLPICTYTGLQTCTNANSSTCIYADLPTCNSTNLPTIASETNQTCKSETSTTKAANTKKTFTMVTTETDELLHKGSIVFAKVVSVNGNDVNCVLDSDLKGTISVDNVSCGGNDVLTIGRTLRCKVTRIKRDKFKAELNCKISEAKPYYGIDFYAARAQKKKMLMRMKRQQQQKVPNQNHRFMNHPLFQHLTRVDAEKYLKDRKPGDLVIRPSPRGGDYMVITCKMANNIYQHIGIKEEKPHANHVSTRYTIGKLVFENLDKLIITYVEAIFQKVNDLMAHPKFQYGGYSALSDYLDSTTRSNPKIDAFGLCLNEKPGYFDLGYKLNKRSKMTHMVVKVLHDGYRLRDTSYPNIDDLINKFISLNAPKTRQQKETQHPQQQQHKQQQQHEKQQNPEKQDPEQQNPEKQQNPKQQQHPKKQQNPTQQQNPEQQQNTKQPKKQRQSKQQNHHSLYQYYLTFFLLIIAVYYTIKWVLKKINMKNAPSPINSTKNIKNQKKSKKRKNNKKKKN